MIKEALEYLMDLADNPTVEDSSGEREWIKGGYTEIVPPVPAALRFYSLTAFIDFIQMEEARDVAFIYVASPTDVASISILNGRNQRAHYATAAPMIDGTFETAHWMNQERFVTDVQAFFSEDSPDKDALLKVAGNIRKHDTTTLEDDGISQQVATAAGVASQALETIPNPVTLRPFETFPEIDQPLRQYIVRFRGGEQGEHIQLALFLVPNPVYSFEVCGDIKTWLQQNLPEKLAKTVLG